MKFTLAWLKDYLDTRATLEEIVDGLIGVGLEVEGSRATRLRRSRPSPWRR